MSCQDKRTTFVAFFENSCFLEEHLSKTENAQF